jgi:hypothetical protein
MEAVAKLNARLCELTRQASAKIMPEATVGFRRAKRINEQVSGIGKQGARQLERFAPQFGYDCGRFEARYMLPTES